jgi:hypothetical protein
VGGVSDRVRRRAKADFPHHADDVIGSLAGLGASVAKGRADYDQLAERVQAAALVVAIGDLRRLRRAVELGLTDWRDLLVDAELAGEDWADRMDAALRPPPAGHVWWEEP